MRIGAKLGLYILQTHSSKNSEDSMEGRVLSPLSPPPCGYASDSVTAASSTRLYQPQAPLYLVTNTARGT